MVGNDGRSCRSVLDDVLVCSFFVIEDAPHSVQKVEIGIDSHWNSKLMVEDQTENHSMDSCLV